MSELPASPPGLQVFETRVYFNRQTGKVISVHQLVSAAGELLDADNMRAEMSEFEKSLRQRHPDVEFISVEWEQILDSRHGMKIDLETRSIVWPIDNGG
jgi:hypothetical protein